MSGVINAHKKYRELFEKAFGQLFLCHFLLKLICQALEEVPELNAEIDGEHRI